MSLFNKTFIKFFAWTGAVVIVLLFLLLPKVAVKKSSEKLLIPYGPLGEGINVLDNVIIVKSKLIKAFSRRCTHLGCSLNKGAGNTIMCPCHGSTFNTDGVVVKGPAVKNLIELHITLDESKKTLAVDLTE
jgi:Rieske Fe-S protein